MSDVIKSFLVGLGFGVDDGELAKFNKAIATASVRVAGLAAGVTAAASAIGYGIAGVSKDFEDIGYQMRLIAPSINRVLYLRQQLLQAYARAGVNISKVVQESVRLNISLAKTRFAFQALYQGVASKFFPLLMKQSESLRNALYANMPKIQAILERFVGLIFASLTAIGQLASRMWSLLGRVYDFFVALHKVTNGWSTIILGAAAAWKILNLAFLASPLGILLALGVAILALYDDFKTAQEGGRSLINWSSDLTRNLEGLVIVAAAVATAFAAWSILESLIGIIEAFNAALAITAAIEVIMAAPFYAVAAAILAVVALLDLLDKKWNIFGGHVSGFFTGTADRVTDFFKGGGNLNAADTAAWNHGLASPLGSSTSNRNSNVTLNQQTNMNIVGSADATSTAKMVAGEQSKGNQNLVKNMKSYHQ